MCENYKFKNDVILTCPSCGSKLKYERIKKIGMCSFSVFYKCGNCKLWEARKDFFDGYILHVSYDCQDD